MTTDVMHEPRTMWSLRPDPDVVEILSRVTAETGRSRTRLIMEAVRSSFPEAYAEVARKRKIAEIEAMKNRIAEAEKSLEMGSVRSVPKMDRKR